MLLGGKLVGKVNSLFSVIIWSSESEDYIDPVHNYIGRAICGECQLFDHLTFILILFMMKIIIMILNLTLLRCDNGTESIGCGPQEEFRACAHLAIHSSNGKHSGG